VSFDIVLVGALALSVVVGVLRGALLEVLALTAMGMALLFCEPLGRFLLPGAAYLMPGASALAVHAAATVFAGIMIFLVGTAITAVVVRLARKKGGKSFSTPNRIVGGALGGVRAVLIWLVVACFVPIPDGEPHSAIGRQMRDSVLLTAANRANPLLRMPLVQDLRTFQAILRSRDRQTAFFALPETQDFLIRPGVVSAVREGSLYGDVARADLAALMRSPPFQAALLERGTIRALRRALAAYRRQAALP